MNNKDNSSKRLSPEKRKIELVEAGIRCLGEGGMTTFTIDKICKRAGVSRGLVNHHFKSKSELLINIYTHMTNYLVQDRTQEWSEMQPETRIAQFIEISFDEKSFKKSNLRAWLSIWGEVATNPALNKLHCSRYGIYKNQLTQALVQLNKSKPLNISGESIARQLIALIDGLWLEYCLHSEGFSLKEAKQDCYQFLRRCGVNLEL